MKQGFTKRKCPKCGGNLFLDRDYCIEGIVINWYEEETCLQCGYTRSNQIPLKPVSGTAVNKAISGMKQLVAI